MVGRCIFYWNSPFLGDMLIFRGVISNIYGDLDQPSCRIDWAKGGLGFLGSPYKRDCYLGIPVESQTTNSPLADHLLQLMVQVFSSVASANSSRASAWLGSHSCGKVPSVPLGVRPCVDALGIHMFLHLYVFYGIFVGKYIVPPMDCLGHEVELIESSFLHRFDGRKIFATTRWAPTYL